MTLGFEDFIELRVGSAGAAGTRMFAEYGLGADLSDVAEHPQLLQLEHAMARHATLTNDLHSFRAEHYRGDHVNAVAYGCLIDGLRLQDSVDRVCEMIADAERSFVRMRRDVAHESLGQRTDVRDYVAELGHMMSGNARWSHCTGRYHGVGHTWNERTHGAVTLLPDRTIHCTP